MFTKEEHFHTGNGRRKLVLEGPTGRPEHLLCGRPRVRSQRCIRGRDRPRPLQAAGLTPVLTEEWCLKGSECFVTVLALPAAACLVTHLQERSLVLASPTVTSGAVFLGVQWKFLYIGLSCLFCYTLTFPLQIVRETLRVF